MACAAQQLRITYFTPFVSGSETLSIYLFKTDQWEQ